MFVVIIDRYYSGILQKLRKQMIQECYTFARDAQKLVVLAFLK